MTHTCQVARTPCAECENKVKSSLPVTQDPTAVEVSKDTNSTTISMGKHINMTSPKAALDGSIKI